MRRKSTFLLALAVATLAIGIGYLIISNFAERTYSVPAKADSDKPDIILISIDSLRPDHLGCYGYRQPTSPTIDGLAGGGVQFENAISTTSWTLPAHAALFTGLYDSAHGLVDNGQRLAENHVTLAEVLDQGQLCALRTNRMKALKNKRNSVQGYFDLHRDPNEQRAITRLNEASEGLLKELDEVRRQRRIGTGSIGAYYL